MIKREHLDDLRGVHVCNKDDKNIGSVEALYIDDETDQPEWALVNTKWFGHRSSFVPLKEANFESGMLNVPYDEETIKRTPTIEPDGHLSEKEESALYHAYGLPAPSGFHIVRYWDVFPNRPLWQT